MKQSDIITTILVAGIGIVVTSLLCNYLLGDPDDLSVSFKTIQPVDATLDEPDAEVFNIEAINPTVEVYVGNCIDQDGDGMLSDTERTACYAESQSINGSEDEEEEWEENPETVLESGPVAIETETGDEVEPESTTIEAEGETENETAENTTISEENTTASEGE